MARAVVSNFADPRVIYKTQYTSVWVKPYYNDNWRYVPYLFPETSTEAAAPSDSEAMLTWDYGKYVNLWGDPGATLLPLNIQNWHVQILVHTIYGTYISWIGIVVGESLSETGIDVATGLPRGEQVIECRGLEYLLERRPIIGTYVGDETGYTYLQRTRDFNTSGSRRENLAGNRSAYINPTSGTYLFSSDGNKWSNFNIIQYLLATFQPWLAFQDTTGQLYYAPQFKIAGQVSALKHIYEEHRFGGRTVREALNSLIDRKRGLGWKIMTDGIGTIYIYVYSISQRAITGNSIVLPANPRQIDVQIHDDKWIQAKYRISSTNQVDWIVVDSEEPVKTMATVRFSNGTLEPAWDPQLDSELALTETESSYRDLAQYLLNNWDLIHESTRYPNIQFFEFYAEASVAPDLFSFLLDGWAGDPSQPLLAGFNALDSDGDGTLSKEDLKPFIPSDSYQLVSDEARATDKYAAVFSHFRVPKTWPWTDWHPQINNNGQIIGFGTSTSWWNHDIAPLRYLPIMEPGSSLDTEREYMEPFAIVAKPNTLRDAAMQLINAGLAPYTTLSSAQAVVSDMTQSMFDDIGLGDGSISAQDLYDYVNANPYHWVYLDKAQQLNLPACSLRMGDSGMKIIVKSEYNHVFAKNHMDGIVTTKEPIFDYRDLAATLFFETDLMPRVAIQIWNNIVRSADGTITSQASPVGRTMYIQVPGKEVWYVAPYTVRGLDETSLDYIYDGSPGILRDDLPDLRSIAMLAEVWYNQQRASLDMTIQNQLTFFQIGDLIRSTWSGWTYERIGTCVTAIQRNYQSGTHQVSTGYGELDPTSFGAQFGATVR